MGKFKVGDEVRLKASAIAEKGFVDWKRNLGNMGKITETEKLLSWTTNLGFRVCFGDDYVNAEEKHLELVTPTGKNIMSNLIEKFALAVKAEPAKSYRKAGITNGDDVLTDDGVKVFLTWLLAKNPDFKTEVVDPILKDKEEEKKE